MMNSEIKTGLILGIAIAASLGILGMIFTTLDQEVQSSTTVTETNSLNPIDKSGFKKGTSACRNCKLSKHYT